ncbi:MAG: galactose oxidase-like domain-containing protein, partial [Solirubrobacteraceae bacterium]
SGFSFLPNGNVFIAGGNKDQQLDGIVQTHTFAWSTGTWSLGVNMAYARWYPTVTGMSNGEMLITSGGPAIPEVRQADGTLRQLTSASLGLPLYPWFDVAPDGRAFDSGPDQTMRSLNPTGTGAWQIWSSRDSINRDYGSHAMYDVGKVLVAGGGPSTNTAEVINLNGATPTATATGSMAYGRRQNNLTVLADGTVLATGGNSSGASLVDMNAGVYAAELWSPASGQWTTLSSMQVTRQYHSTALLLPDGRVLSAGGGICGTCDTVGYLNKNAEIFSPPYLFAKDGSGSLAPRPTVAAVPSSVSEGGQFTVSTPDAASISKVALVKLGAVTHSNNMDQRYVPLSFSAGNGTLTVTAPANINIAPPGYYMLFIVNSAGVPSIAPILSVTGVPPTVQITAPASGSTFPFKPDITINATASDSDGTVRKVEFLAGTTKLGESTTAPYSFVWHRPGPGTYALTARATDNSGLMTTSAPVTVTVRKH